MNQTLAEKVRLAHRFVAAYEQRVIQAYRQIAARLADEDYFMREWGAMYNNKVPGARSSDWTRRWAWDYLPLHSVRGWWQRGDDEKAPGTAHVLVEHVVDSAYEQWRRQKKDEQPDPLAFEQSAETFWRVRWLRNLSARPIPDATWGKGWVDIFEAVCVGTVASAKIGYITPADGLLEGEHDGLAVGGFAVSLDELATPEDFTAKLTARLIEHAAHP